MTSVFSNFVLRHPVISNYYQCYWLSKRPEIIQVWLPNWVVCCHTADCYNTLAAMYISSAYCLLFYLSVFISVVFVSIHPSIRHQLLLESAANLCWKTAVAVWREKSEKKKELQINHGILWSAFQILNLLEVTAWILPPNFWT